VVLHRPVELAAVIGRAKCYFKSPVTRLIRWDEKAGLQRDAIRSQ